MRKVLLSIVLGVFLVSAPAHADTLGQQETFRVDSDFDRDGRTSLTATLRHVGDHAYFYVDDSVWAGFTPSGRALFTDDLKELAAAFDADIWPRERDLFGFEPDPGIDDDSRVVILLEALRKGNGGYFDATNVYSKTDFPDSNEREMIVVNAEAMASGYAKPFLAHEFQHLISVNQKEFQRGTNEDVWLNELRSEYAVSVAGFNDPYLGSSLQSRTEAFLRSPSDSLTEWPNVSQDYASVALFGEYLVGRYGQNFLRETLQSTLRGIASLNQYFAGRQLPERFADVFSDWMLASYLNDGTVRFGYANRNLASVRVTPQFYHVVYGDRTFSAAASVKDWQPMWQEFAMGQSGVGTDRGLKLEIVAADALQDFAIPYVVFFADGSYDIERLTLDQGRRTAYVLSGDPSSPQPTDKQITKILVALTKTEKTEGFGMGEPSSAITTSISLVGKEVIQAAMGDGTVTFNSRARVLRDGALIRRNGEQDIYVIKGRYKRFMPPEAVGLYGHLNLSNVISVTPDTFDSYETSNYILGIDTKPVYAIWWDNSKHWINVSAAQWEASGRDWDAIFIVNPAELNYYPRGTDVTQ